MSEYKYVKSYSVDFSSNLRNDVLVSEIEADGGVGPTCTRVDWTGDVVDIVFDSEPSAGEKSIIDGLVAAHFTLPFVAGNFKFMTIDSSYSPFKIKRTSLKCDTSGGSITVNLTKAARSKNACYIIHKIDAANTVTIDPQGAETIGGFSTHTLSALNDFVHFQSDGTTWNIITGDNPLNQAENMLNATTTDSKGDLIVDDGMMHVDLPVGSDGQVLMGDSAADTGLAYGDLQDISGLLTVGQGGTGATTLTQDGWLMGNGTGAVTSVKSNWAAAVAPTATDDSSSGYAVGSRWIDTTANKEYVCLDATATSAVWTETTQTGSGGEINLAANVGTGSGWWRDKTGVTLNFRSLVAGSTKLSVASNADDLTVDVAEANIDHNSLTNYSSLEHIDWTGDAGASNIHDNNILASSITQHQASIDHGSIAGLGDDDHAQYALLAGRATGQTIIGGTASGEDLTLESTSHATKGTIIALDPIESNSYLEFTDITAPTNPGSGLGRLYKKTGNDGIFWLPDAAGPEVDLTSMTGFPTTTKGDMIVHNGSNDVRLPVGSDGQVLRALASDPEGVVWGTKPDLYDAIADPSGAGDYTTVKAAFDAGAKTVFARDGTYLETGDVVIPSGGHLIGESMDQTIINFQSAAYSVKTDGNGGVSETTGTVSVTYGSSAVVGTGTTFTNISLPCFILIDQNYYPVASITDATNLSIGPMYRGPSRSGVSFRLQQMDSTVSVQRVTIINSTVAAIYIRANRHSTFEDIVCRNNAKGMEVVASGNTNFNSIMCQNQSGDGYLITDTASCVLEGCQAFNSGGHGYHLNGMSTDVEFSGCQGSHSANNGLHIAGTCTDITVNGSIFNNNKLDGIETIPGTITTAINGCTMNGNGVDGIDFDGTDNIVDACIISNNARYGVRTGDNGTVSNNHIYGNTNTGIHMNVDSQCQIVGNYIYSNGNDGIFLDEDNNSITGNSIYGNTGYGVRVNGGHDNVISSNYIANNTIDNVQIDTSSLRNKVIGNSIRGGTIGIDVASGCVNTTISDNTVSGASSHGINVAANTCMVVGNRCTSNTGDGCKIVAGATDVTVLGNNFQGNTGTDFNDLGTITSLEGILINDLDARSATTLLLGAAIATKVEIADTGIITEIQGNLDALAGVDVTGDISLSGSILDTSANEYISFTSTGSAVNQINITNAATAGTPVISAVGGDTNIDFSIQPKGTGNLILDLHNWPTSDGTTNQVMKTDGSGNLGWATVETAVFNTVTTTDAIATNLITQATATDTTYVIEVTVAARRTDAGTESGGYHLKATFSNDSGVLTQVSTTDTVAFENTPQWAAEFGISGTNIKLDVTGQAGKTINWRSSCKLLDV